MLRERLREEDLGSEAKNRAKLLTFVEEMKRRLRPFSRTCSARA
jgi:hypothetical protein